MIQSIKELIENVLYPALRPYGRSERDRLLLKASETPLDFVEWTGILVSLVAVAALTRYNLVDLRIVDRILIILVNFFTSLALLGITAGPFLIRRTRRGLHLQLH